MIPHLLPYLPEGGWAEASNRLAIPLTPNLTDAIEEVDEDGVVSLHPPQGSPMETEREHLTRLRGIFIESIP